MTQRPTLHAYRPRACTRSRGEPGGPEVMEWTEVPDPVAGPGEVLIDVVAVR